MRVAPILLAIVVLMAGCTQAPKPNCDNEQCVSPPSASSTPLVSRPPNVTFPPVPVNATLRSIQLENCTGWRGSIDAPRTWVDDATPNEFRNSGETPATAAIVIDLLNCHRLVEPGAITPDFQLLRLAASVEPRNSSWAAGDGASWYAFDFFVSSEKAAQTLKSWGLAARPATFASDSFPDGNSRVWTITSNDTTIEFNHPLSTDPNRAIDPQLNSTSSYWTGEGPFLRATRGVVYTYVNGIQYGSIQFEGPSKTASVIQTGAQTIEGRQIVRHDEVMTVDVELFGGQE